ncbi:hypothetical protein ABW21_db0205867 [Orbilia brochopaga]|nr:hypothetical protein ABW21_db0205867 [Drechslerella brochopaga]
MALELTTGIAGLIALADIIVLKGSKFYSLSKNAIPEIQGLLKEVVSLAGALYTLEKTIQMLSVIGTDQGQGKGASLIYIEDCKKCILELEAVLKKCGPKDATKWEKVKASLRWPLSVSETRVLAQKVQRLKSIILVGTEADSLAEKRPGKSEAGGNGAREECKNERKEEARSACSRILL